MISGPRDRRARFAAIPDGKKALTNHSVSVRLGFVGELNDQQQTFARRFHVSMKASTRQVKGVTIVDLSGNIKLGEGTSVLRETVKDLVGKGQKKMLLNLAEISYIDSSGIGELVSAFTSVRNQGGELKLLHLTKKVHDLLQITKLYTVFDVKDDEAAAISAFG
jgi:anti-sigma B factor antagonist